MAPSRSLEAAERIVHATEVVVAYLLVVLFAVGAFDLALELFGLARTGEITDPRTLIDVLDIALLLFVIVEVFQTVVAYATGSDERMVVRLVVYAGVIAVVRKIIVFKPTSYPGPGDALSVALAYGALLVGLAIVLAVEYRFRDP